MKRSDRFKAEYQTYFQYSATWFFVSVFLASMAYAYQIWLVIPTAVTVCLMMRWFFDAMNKRRAYRVEVRYEKSRRIKNDTFSL